LRGDLKDKKEGKTKARSKGFLEETGLQAVIFTGPQHRMQTPLAGTELSTDLCMSTAEL